MRKTKPLPKAQLAELTLQNKARILAGLEPIKFKVRTCLACQRQFESLANRICGCTKGLDDVLYHSTSTFFSNERVS